MQMICRRVDETSSAVTRRAGSGRPKSACTAEKIAQVEEMISSQEDNPATSKCSRQIVKEINISATSVRRIAKFDLELSVVDASQLKS